MRILSIAILVLSLSACSQMGGSGKTVSNKDLVQKENIYYLGDAETPFSGKASDKYNSGAIYFEGSYIDGKPDGTHTWYYENGNKKYEFIYTNGKPEGTWSTYYEDGSKESEMYYENGKFSDRKDFPKTGEAENVVIENKVENPQPVETK